MYFVTLRLLYILTLIYIKKMKHTLFHVKDKIHSLKIKMPLLLSVSRICLQGYSTNISFLFLNSRNKTFNSLMPFIDNNT